MLMSPSLSSPNTRIRPRLTHIGTLNTRTPKGRRRIRRLLELKPGARITGPDAIFARAEAHQRETRTLMITKADGAFARGGAFYREARSEGGVTA